MSGEIGRKIKELRTLHGMSQEELGKRIGVQRAAIQKYEKGAIENISVKTIESIANIFDVSPTYLTGWDNVSQNNLAVEVRLLQAIKVVYGKDCVDLLEGYINLNKQGQVKCHQYIEDIAPKYELPDIGCSAHKA